MCDTATSGCFLKRSRPRKENGRSVPDVTASPGRAPPGPLPNQMQPMVNQQQQQQQQMQHMQQQQQQQQQQHMLQQRQSGVKEPVLLQGDFRKVSGISSEIFRQIEAVENDHDPNTAAALEAVERRGEMIVRILEPRCIGGKQAIEAAHKLMAKGDARHTVQLVEIVKRPGQTLGLYIREGNGADRTDGVFISRIALESAVYNSGCLRVGDEILAVNLVDVTHMSLDDVVIIMSIPRRLVLAIRQRRGNRGTSSPSTLSRPEQKPPPVVVIKRDLRDEGLDETDRMPRSRSSRERRTGDGREMSESRSRLGLGLNNYSPQSEQLDLYYNTRAGVMNEPPTWGYKPPPPPSVITEQPKSHSFAPSHAYYQNAGTLESLAEKVHSFYPSGPSRRMSTGTGVGLPPQQQLGRFPRSGSDQYLPRVEYADYSNSLGRHSLLRSSIKSNAPQSALGGTLGRYRYEPSRSSSKYAPSNLGVQSLTRRSRPNLDYSSDTEANIGSSRPSYYYYNRPAISSMSRQAAGPGPAGLLSGNQDISKFNSLPRDRPGIRLNNIRSRLGDRLMDENDGNISAPEFNARRDRDLRSKMNASPSIFTSDEYRAWLRRAPSSSAIAEQMRLTRDLLSQPRPHRFSCSAENIHDALRNTESIYSSRTGILGAGTLDRHLGISRPMSALPVRSMSSQHIGGNSIRSPSVRRMRQLLELSAGPASPSGSIISTGGHQSPAPTPSATMPRTQRQIDINPAEFSKYKLDKPIVDIGGVSGMLWIHLLAGRGLRATPEIGAHHMGGTHNTPQSQMRDLYCVIECDRVHKARTVVRSGDLQFDWDESFELDLVGNKQLDVLVYSWDPQHRHKLCYRGALSLSALLRQSPLHQLALKVEPRGTIYIRMRHTDPVTLYRRRGLPSLRAGYPTLFGADLETVVNRESKGAPGSAPVPIVLRRCVEEVERRGLDIIGLYRLCGSATKKRLLREAFERNSRAVELSPEHVPDINVITGVLKDYLRELPEPLFTRCLFQMTVDALAVCLPDDPEGNAKLMLSILDCLPRANRATLVFLLDHLSLVVSNSERNKMSAQALATVMGPPLMLHSASTQPGCEIDHAQPIAVLKYLLQIWPQPQHSMNTLNLMNTVGGHGLVAGSMGNVVGAVSGRRGESTEQRGSKVNALRADRQQLLLQQQQQLMAAGNLLRSYTSVTNILSQDHHPPSATVNSHLFQSVVGQLAQSPRVLQQVVPQPHQLAASAGSAIPDQSPLPLPGTPSPGSSSTSTGSGSGSGKSTDTIKRGASPSSVKRLNIQDSTNAFATHYSNTNSNSNNKKASLQKTSPVKDTSAINDTTTTTQKRADYLEKKDKNSDTSSKSSFSKLQKSFEDPTSTDPPLARDKSALHSMSTTDYKAMLKRSSEVQLSTAGTTASTTNTTTNSSDDSDELLSYKSSASTNALLAQSQALTTSQLMSKYLKREPRVQFTPIKSPDSPSPPGSTNHILKGTYHITSTDNSKASPTTISSSTYNGRNTITTTTSTTADTTTSSKSESPPYRQLSASHKRELIKETIKSKPSAISSSSLVSTTSSLVSTSLPSTSIASSTYVSTGRRLFDSLAAGSEETSSYEHKTYNRTQSGNNSVHSIYGRNYDSDNDKLQSSEYKSSSGHRSFDSSDDSSSYTPFSRSHHLSSDANGANGSNKKANTMNIYGTLPKNGTSSAATSHASSGLGSSIFCSSSSYYTSTSDHNTASSSGISSMTGSTNSYDTFGTSSSTTSQYGSTSHSYTNGGASSTSATSTAGGGGNYHTLGTYKVQYAATNPFLDIFDPQSISGNGNGGSRANNATGTDYHAANSLFDTTTETHDTTQSGSDSKRNTLLTAFGTSESRSGSDEYDDLK